MLAQLGVIDKKGLPVAGIEAAQKVKGEKIPSNQMMPSWKRSEGKG